MKILAIETSCDETAAAIIEAESRDKKVKVLSNVVSSSLKLHAKTGGVIPEIAARQQIKYIIPVIEQALNIQGSTRGVDAQKIDAIAVTVGPGLIGSLLIGVETAKTLAFAWNKPIIPVNHLFGHIYANFIQEGPSSLRGTSSAGDEAIYSNKDRHASLAMTDKSIEFPFIGLIVSGGHTDLLLFKSHKNYKWLGGTRDDAAGEALDKIARILGLSYPGGPEIEKRALIGNPKAFNFPRPMLDSNDFDFSFSGLKTAVQREILKYKDVRTHSKTYPVIPARRFGEASPLGGKAGIQKTWIPDQVGDDKELNDETINNICASAQQAIVDVLVKKTVRAAKEFNVSTIVLGGGVTSNEYLRSQFKVSCEAGSRSARQLFVPSAQYTTDNAAMIATTAFFQYKEVPWSKITANPELYFD
ncbi:MAG: tRNA (adenosine(37)-N6)-threonylcarbamoyltransferase complex transferase subunit TsaD [Candidatus Levybacteria bacterium]|nr:tRNA (adenosine(37)-N6)-threonylcarbamoyltransferase complex transferase subunit TsaD [Candidatus Levybacteria bacterium]